MKKKRRQQTTVPPVVSSVDPRLLRTIASVLRKLAALLDANA